MKSRLNTITDEQIIAALPHGSGIDATWVIERQKNGKVRCYNAFHAMNEDGYYDGWQEFCVILYPHTKEERHALCGPCAGKVQITARPGDIDMDIISIGKWTRRSWGYDLRDYLYKTIQYALSATKIIDPMRNDVVSEETDHESTGKLR